MQGISERQAAKERKVPRTTLQAWRLWHDTLDSCPHVANFFQSGPGLAFLHRLVIAFHLVCVEVGACGYSLGVSLPASDGAQPLCGGLLWGSAAGQCPSGTRDGDLWPR